MRGEAPNDIEIFEVALLLHMSPTDVRSMPYRDIQLVKAVKIAQSLAREAAINKSRAR